VKSLSQSFTIEKKKKFLLRLLSRKKIDCFPNRFENFIEDERSIPTALYCGLMQHGLYGNRGGRAVRFT